MNKNIFLLLGGNRLNYGIFKKFKKLGYLVYVIDWNENPYIIGDKHYKIDVKDSDTIINIMKQDNLFDNIAFAYSSIDLAVVSVAKINRAIGLYTISDYGLRYASSKSMQSICWEKENILNKIARQYNKYNEDIYELNKIYKLIIKPDNSASSRGITIISQKSNETVIKKAFIKAQNEASNGIVVVEEFVEGIEHTVEMIGDNYGNVSVYAISRKTHTKNIDNNKVAVKLHYNSITDKLQNNIAEFAIKCYKTLGFSNSLGHLEVIVKKNGIIVPVEIGARSSGFIASDLVDIVSNSNFMSDLINVQQGAKVKNGLHIQSDKSSMYFFYDFPENIEIKQECNLLDFISDKIYSRYYNRENIIIGKKFNKIENDNARLGFEILEGPKTIMTDSHINIGEQKMLDVMFGRK